ncbi:MAG: ABC transporter permease [Planctomycetaceae bacterium]|nr:ABC transporter permease [Planctomycetaceae bacterium]
MLRFAFANLLSRPGRTVLSTLGLTIAVAGMVGLFAIAGGLDDMLEEGLGEVPGVVVQQPGAPIPLFSSLPADWGAEMADIDGVHVVNLEVWARVNLLDGKTIFSPPRLLVGFDIPNRLRLWKPVYPPLIENGRFLDESDIGRRHVVISRQISEDLGKQVGDSVDVNGHAMSIIGIYHSGKLIVDMSMITDAGVVREMSRIEPNTVNCFYLEPDEGVTAAQLKERVQAHFAGREPTAWRPSDIAKSLTIPPNSFGELLTNIGNLLVTDAATSESSDEGETPALTTNEKESAPALEVHSVAEYGDRFAEMSADLDLILGLLTGLGMLIAVFSILNTMLMSVTERTIEFGILRANGWSHGDIVQLITSESAIIGLAGGVLGGVLGWIGTQIVNTVWADRAHLYAGPMLLTFSLLFSIMVGMLGGLYPAIRAARLSPMQAIRRG